MKEKDVVGTYEVLFGKGQFTLRYFFLENGNFESSLHGEMVDTSSSIMRHDWQLVGKEVYVFYGENSSTVFKIKPNGILNMIATIKDGKRTEHSEEEKYIMFKSAN